MFATSAAKHDSPVLNSETLAIWMHVYSSGKGGTMVVDVEALKANTKKLPDNCVQNPDVPLLGAVETFLKP